MSAVRSRLTEEELQKVGKRRHCVHLFVAVEEEGTRARTKKAAPAALSNA